MKDFDESPVTYDGALTKKDLAKWVKSVAYPPFAILDQCATLPRGLGDTEMYHGLKYTYVDLHRHRIPRLCSPELRRHIL